MRSQRLKVYSSSKPGPVALPTCCSAVAPIRSGCCRLTKTRDDEIPPCGESEPPRRLLPDLEDVEPEPLPRGTPEVLRELVDRQLRRADSTAALLIHQRVVGGGPAGDDVGDDVLLAHGRLGGEVEREAVGPALGGHVDQHLLVVRIALGGDQVLGGHVQGGRLRGSLQGDGPLLEREGPSIEVHLAAARDRLHLSEELHRLTRLLPDVDPAGELDVDAGTRRLAEPDPPGESDIEVHPEAVHEAGPFRLSGDGGRSEALGQRGEVGRCQLDFLYRRRGFGADEDLGTPELQLAGEHRLRRRSLEREIPGRHRAQRVGMRDPEVGEARRDVERRVGERRQQHAAACNELFLLAGDKAQGVDLEPLPREPPRQPSLRVGDAE